jgi:hypothetical protein
MIKTGAQGLLLQNPFWKKKDDNTNHSVAVATRAIDAGIQIKSPDFGSKKRTDRRETAGL